MVKEKNHFNRNHPELKDGEVWIGNVTKGKEELILWKTKRFGATAYDCDGKVTKGAVPVFTQVTELEKAGLCVRGLLPARDLEKID